MISSGGMPSSHSATVTALAVAIGLEEGAGAPAFAIAVVLACVVSFLLSSCFHFKLSLCHCFGTSYFDLVYMNRIYRVTGCFI